MSEDEQGLSKYAKKQLAKAAGTWKQPDVEPAPERDPALENHFRYGEGAKRYARDKSQAALVARAAKMRKTF